MRRFFSIALLALLFATGPALKVAFSQQGPCVQPGDLNTTIKQRIADWVKLGDKRLLDGVPEDGGDGPVVDSPTLAKALQAAFDGDTVKVGSKASAKDGLAKALKDTAQTLRDATSTNNQLKLGQEILTTKGGAFRGLQANIETNVGTINLPKTQAVISSFLSSTLKRDDTGALTAPFLNEAATKLDQVATALASVK